MSGGRHRKGNLRRSQGRSEACRPTGSHGAVSERRGEVASRGQPGWIHTEQQGHSSGEHDREQQDCRIELKAQHGTRLLRDERRNPAQRPPGHGEASETAGSRQQEALRQHLTHESAPSRAKRQPDCDITFS